MHHAREEFDGTPREHRYQRDNSETTRGRSRNMDGWEKRMSPFARHAGYGVG